MPISNNRPDPERASSQPTAPEPSLPRSEIDLTGAPAAARPGGAGEAQGGSHQPFAEDVLAGADGHGAQPTVDEALSSGESSSSLSRSRSASSATAASDVSTSASSVRPFVWLDKDAPKPSPGEPRTGAKLTVSLSLAERASWRLVPTALEPALLSLVAGFDPEQAIALREQLAAFQNPELRSAEEVVVTASTVLPAIRPSSSRWQPEGAGRWAELVQSHWLAGPGQALVDLLSNYDVEVRDKDGRKRSFLQIDADAFSQLPRGGLAFEKYEVRDNEVVEQVWAPFLNAPAVPPGLWKATGADKLISAWTYVPDFVKDAGAQAATAATALRAQDLHEARTAAWNSWYRHAPAVVNAYSSKKGGKPKTNSGPALQPLPLFGSEAKALLLGLLQEIPPQFKGVKLSVERLDRLFSRLDFEETPALSWLTVHPLAEASTLEVAPNNSRTAMTMRAHHSQLLTLAAPGSPVSSTFKAHTSVRLIAPVDGKLVAAETDGSAPPSINAALVIRPEPSTAEDEAELALRIGASLHQKLIAIDDVSLELGLPALQAALLAWSQALIGEAPAATAAALEAIASLRLSGVQLYAPQVLSLAKQRDVKSLALVHALYAQQAAKSAPGASAPHLSAGDAAMTSLLVGLPGLPKSLAKVAEAALQQLHPRVDIDLQQAAVILGDTPLGAGRRGMKHLELRTSPGGEGAKPFVISHTAVDPAARSSRASRIAAFVGSMLAAPFVQAARIICWALQMIWAPVAWLGEKLDLFDKQTKPKPASIKVVPVIHSKWAHKLFAKGIALGWLASVEVRGVDIRGDSLHLDGELNLFGIFALSLSSWWIAALLPKVPSFAALATAQAVAAQPAAPAAPAAPAPGNDASSAPAASTLSLATAYELMGKLAKEARISVATTGQDTASAAQMLRIPLAPAAPGQQATTLLLPTSELAFTFAPANAKDPRGEVSFAFGLEGPANGASATAARLDIHVQAAFGKHVLGEATADAMQSSARAEAKVMLWPSLPVGDNGKVPNKAPSIVYRGESLASVGQKTTEFQINWRQGNNVSPKGFAADKGAARTSDPTLERKRDLKNTQVFEQVFGVHGDFADERLLPFYIKRASLSGLLDNAGLLALAGLANGKDQSEAE